jgi:hypothetical protein
MSFLEPRKSKNRRLTQISQNSVKLVEEHSENYLPPVVPSEIYEYLSKMVNPEKYSKKVLFDSAVKLLKATTNSTWVELFLIKKNRLKNYSEKQKIKYLDINPSDNMLSYCLVNKTPLLITNPHTSALYTRFPTHLDGFSMLTQQQIKLYSLACIPLLVINR